jgi:hypothetical protein
MPLVRTDRLADFQRYRKRESSIDSNSFGKAKAALVRSHITQTSVSRTVTAIREYESL